MKLAVSYFFFFLKINKYKEQKQNLLNLLTFAAHQIKILHIATPKKNTKDVLSTNSY